MQVTLGVNPAPSLCFTKDCWALSSRWQKYMPVKVEQIYLISFLIIWSIHQPFWAPVHCVTQTYWQIKEYCHLHIKELFWYCLAQSNGLVLLQYSHFSVILKENHSLIINRVIGFLLEKKNWHKQSIQNISHCVGRSSQHLCKLAHLSLSYNRIQHYGNKHHTEQPLIITTVTIQNHLCAKLNCLH